MLFPCPHPLSCLHLYNKESNLLNSRVTNHMNSAVEKSGKLVLRCYNMNASQQEVSVTQMASYLMNYGDHFTTHTFKSLSPFYN